jgi:CheY-like chemotaxis protein
MMTYKVLVVDDSKLARMSFAKLLSKLRPDWVRIEAADAEEAMKAVITQGPDIVILDFNMPGRDGLEIASELQAHHPKISVAVISANIQVEVVARAKAAGAVFLPKPLTEQALAEFIYAAEPRLAALGT